jgi:hypothetical protein
MNLKNLFLCLFLLFLSILTACSAVNNYASGGLGAKQAAYSTREAAYDSAAAESLAAAADLGFVENPRQEQRLIQTAEIRIRVEEPARAETAIRESMNKYGAYAASTSSYENSFNYTIRVPAESFNILLAELEGMGKILYKAERTEDVTLRYYDLDGRLETKRELLRTFREYLGEARSIEEIMAVETRIAELQNEIDWLGTELTSLSNQIDYATIEAALVGPALSSYYEPGAGERIAELFKSFGKKASTALVILTGVVVYGIPVIIVITALFWILFGRIGLLRKLWLLAAGNRKPFSSRSGSGEPGS